MVDVLCLLVVVLLICRMRAVVDGFVLDKGLLRVVEVEPVNIGGL